MISYINPACTVPRPSFRERKRASLVQPVAAVFEIRGDGPSCDQGPPDFDQSGPDIAQLQAQASQSRLQFDLAFNRAIQELEFDEQDGGFCEFC